MSDLQRFRSLTFKGHRMTVEGRQIGIGCAGCIEQNCRDRPADGRPFHQADQKAQDRQQASSLTPNTQIKHRQ